MQKRLSEEIKKRRGACADRRKVEGGKLGRGNKEKEQEGRNLMTGEGMMKLVMQLGRIELYKSGNFARHLRGQR